MLEWMWDMSIFPCANLSHEDTEVLCPSDEDDRVIVTAVFTCSQEHWDRTKGADGTGGHTVPVSYVYTK